MKKILLLLALVSINASASEAGKQKLYGYYTGCLDAGTATTLSGERIVNGKLTLIDVSNYIADLSSNCYTMSLLRNPNIRMTQDEIADFNAVTLAFREQVLGETINDVKKYKGFK